MNIPNIESIREVLKDMKLNVVADAAGVNYVTLTRFVNGSTQDPGYEFVFKIAKYLEEKFATVKGV